MTELIPSSNPFNQPAARMKRPKSPAEKSGRLDLATPWKTVDDLERNVAALPPNIKDAITRREEPTSPANLDFKISRYLEDSLFFSSQLKERLDRGEQPEKIKKEIIDQINRFFVEHKAPFADREYLKERYMEIKDEYSMTSRRRQDLMAARKQLESDILALKSKKVDKNTLRQKEKEYEKLKGFLEGSAKGAGALDRLSEKANNLYALLKEREEELHSVEEIERIVAQNASLLKSKEVVEIFDRIASNLGGQLAYEIRRKKFQKRDAEVFRLEQSLMRIKDIFFEAIIEWLDSQPKQKQENKKNQVLASHFDEVYRMLKNSKNTDPSSIEANLQHAQIILRRLVALAS